jgi:hypothetical protein
MQTHSRKWSTAISFDRMVNRAVTPFMKLIWIIVMVRPVPVESSPTLPHSSNACGGARLSLAVDAHGGDAGAVRDHYLQP